MLLIEHVSHVVTYKFMPSKILKKYITIKKMRINCILYAKVKEYQWILTIRKRVIKGVSLVGVWRVCERWEKGDKRR